MTATVIAVTMLAFAPRCAAQSFSLPSRVMRDRLPPQAPLSITRPPPASERSKVHSWRLLFKAQVERCWRKPRAASREPIQAIFSIRLSRAGLIEDLRLVSISPDTPDADAYLASCLRTLEACQPYTLPDAEYDQWRSFEPVFTLVDRGKPQN